jgi:nucleoside-diphosphate-sugar epimerase
MITSIHITGASGFVGKNLVQFLSGKNCIVHSVNLRIPFVEGIFSDTDVVVHLAGKAHDLKKSASPNTYYEVNTELSKKVFDAFLASPARVFIMLSSVKAVADSVEGILTEETPPAPGTHYGKSKLLAEQQIMGNQIPDGKKVFILRPSMIHGPGNKGNLNLLFKLIKRRIPYPLASFWNERSFLSIENLCFVINELVQSNAISPGIYNISDADPLSTNRIIEIIGEELRRKQRMIYIGKKSVRFLARLGDALRLPLNSERLQKLTESYVVDSTKLINALGKSLPIGSEEGLRRTIRSFFG